MPGDPGSELIRLRASAGAGKTYQLSLHYLNLLKSFGEPGPQNLRRIVAITFTNKAAEEMKERILRFLKEIALEMPFSRKTFSANRSFICSDPPPGLHSV